MNHNILPRLWRHLTTRSADGRRAFPQETLDAIRRRIEDGERQHRAEVRMVIETSLTPWQILRRETARMQAAELFLEQGIWDTEENVGILVYILLADHKVEIMADRAVGRAISPDEWRSVCRLMTEAFHAGDYSAGALAALERLNTLLAERFPDDGSSTNQLSNEPLVL